MKWPLLCFAGILCCSASPARADAASDLYAKGVAADAAGDDAGAVAIFDQIITDYPTSASIDDVRFRAGVDYSHLGDNTKAVDRLSKLIAKNARPETKGIALFYTGLAQMGLSDQAADATAKGAALTRAASTFTDLVNFIAATPTPANQDLLEDTLYYRAFTQFQRRDFPDAEKDLLQLVQQFNSSLRRPDYELLLGTLYASEANDAVNAKKPTDPADPIKAIAAKAIAALDAVSSDPNALIQANQADMSKAEVLFLIAQLDLPATDGYAKALDAFRLVRRRDDLAPAQTRRIDELKAKAQSQVQTADTATSAKLGRLISREQGRLSDLQKGQDPIIEALIRIAECYNSMKQGDEARTVLHRLAQAQNELTPAQQQEVDFQTIYSYALGGQTDKADAALTDYLTKHPGDKQADSISYQLAAGLMARKDYNGALAQANRSIKDFPSGNFVAAAYTVKAEALKDLGRFQESDAALAEAAKLPGQGMLKFQNELAAGQNKAAQGDQAGALALFKMVMDDPEAKELQPSGGALYIQSLMALQKYDDVIAEAKNFAQKYPDSTSLPGVLVLGAVALDKKNDPGAIAALQDVAKKFPNDEASGSYALSRVVAIYQRENKVPEMTAAALDLRTAYPTAYPALLQAANAVSEADAKLKKFDDAIAQYKSLVDAPKPAIAVEARSKVGALWLADAKSMGSYQSLQQTTDRDEAQRRLSQSEQTYLGLLKAFPDQPDAIGGAFQGLDEDLLARRSWGLLKDADMDAYLGTLTANLGTPDLQAHAELARAGLVFIEKDGKAQYPAALDRFKKTVDANPSLALTRQETDHFGELLIAGKEYDRAVTVYTALLNGPNATDPYVLGDAYYGLGATYLAQDQVDQARDYFLKLKALPSGGAWHKHIRDAEFGLAQAAERSANPADNLMAKQAYASLMRDPQSNFEVQAKSMLGYGRLLEKAGHGLQAPGQQDIEYALHYYQQVNTFYGPSVPKLSAEGLYLSGLLYEKNNDKVNAKAQFNQVVTAYGATAPDWTAKAQAELAKLGA